MKRIKTQKRFLYIVITIIVIFIFIMTYYYASGTNNSYSKYKIDKSKKIVYTIYNQDKIIVPTINVKGKNIEKINNKIIDKANKYISTDNRVINYDYDISGKILSLAIQYADYNEKDRSPKITYDVYNIDLEEKKALSNKEVLNIYEVNENDVKGIVESKFGEYYTTVLNKEYMSEDKCDYECFLYFRGIIYEQYMKEAYYYIKDGDLYVIRPFNIFSYYDEDKYFTDSHFYIQITN